MKLRKIFGLFITSIAAITIASCNNTPHDETKPDDLKHVHTFTDTVIMPTCKDEGYTLRTCDCGYIEKDNFIDKVSHEGDFVCKYCNKDLRGESFYKNMLSALKDGFSIDVTKLFYESLNSEFKNEEVTIEANASVYLNETKALIVNMVVQTTTKIGDEIDETITTYTSENNALCKISYQTHKSKGVSNTYGNIVRSYDFDDSFMKDIASVCKEVVGYVNAIYKFFPIVYDLLPLEIFETLFDLKKTDTGYLMTLDQNTLNFLDSMIMPLFTDTCANVFNEVIKNFAGNEAYKQIFNNDAALFYSDIDNLTALLKSISVSELVTLVDDYIGKLIPYSSFIFGTLYPNDDSPFKNITGVFNIINAFFDLGLELDLELYEQMKDLDVFTAVAKWYGIKDTDMIIEVIHNALYNEDEGIMKRNPIDVLVSIFMDVSGSLEPTYRYGAISFVSFVKLYYVGLKDSNVSINLDEAGYVKNVIWDLTKVNYTNENYCASISNCESIKMSFGTNNNIDISKNKNVYELYSNAMLVMESADFKEYISDIYIDGETVSITNVDNDYYLTVGEDNFALCECYVSYDSDNYIIIYRFVLSDRNKEIKIYSYYDKNLNHIRFVQQ